jgi:transcriptional regulator with XRE-family HTH domain
MHAYSRTMRITPRAGALYNYCKDHDISRDELARRMKVSTATAYRVDAGKSDPSPQFIASLMDVTELPFEDLFEIVREAAA